MGKGDAGECAHLVPRERPLHARLRSPLHDLALQRQVGVTPPRVGVELVVVEGRLKVLGDLGRLHSGGVRDAEHLQALEAGGTRESHVRLTVFEAPRQIHLRPVHTAWREEMLLQPPSQVSNTRRDCRGGE